MDKDEILAKSREENQNKDLAEAEVKAQVSTIALKVGVCICFILTFLHQTYRGSYDYGVWIVYIGIFAATCLGRYAKLRQRRDLVCGLLCIPCGIFFFVLYLRRVLGVF